MLPRDERFDDNDWVRRLVINRATSRRRRLGAEMRALAGAGPDPDSTLPDLSTATTEVWEEVRRLSRRQRQAVVLHYVGQLSMNEIGEAMGCSTGAIKSHLHRARETLGRRIGLRLRRAGRDRRSGVHHQLRRGVGSTTFARWEEEGYGEMDTLIRLFGTSHAVTEIQDGPDIYVWPAAVAGWAQELDEIAKFGSYAAWRIGIDENGDWRFFIAGD